MLDAAFVVSAAIIAGLMVAIRRSDAVRFTQALLVVAILGRAVVWAFDLSPILYFAHYLLAAQFLIAAALRARAAGRFRFVQALRWSAVLVGLVAIALVFNRTNPLRAALFLAIFVEPLLVMSALQLSEPSDEERRRIVGTAVVLFAVQVPLVVGQGLILRWGDPVVGTLVDHGAGAHVVGGLAALWMFVTCGKLRSRHVGVWSASIQVAAALFVMFAAGARQVVVAAALGLVASVFLRSREDGSRDSRLRFAIVGAAIVGVLLLQVVQPTILRRSVNLVVPTVASMAAIVEERLENDPGSVAIGSGPGAGASRAGLLLTPRMLKADSPLRLLGLEATDTSRAFARKTLVPRWGGSAESLYSSVLSLLVDLGVLGLVGWIFVAGSLLNSFRRRGDWLALAAAAAVAATLILAFVDVWLEYPEFTVPLAVILGLATAPETKRDSGSSSEQPRGSVATMRILLVIPNLGCGGAERVMTTMARWWAERGVEVSLVTTEPDIPDFYPLHPEVRRLSIEPHRLFGRRGLGRIHQLRALRRVVSEFQPDVVLSFLARSNALAVPAARAEGISVIVSDRCDQRDRPMSPAKTWVRRLICRRASAYVVPCEGVARWAGKAVREPVVIGNPVSRPSTIRSATHPSARRVIAMGRLVDQKGFDLLLRAFAMVRRRHRDWTLTIIGEGAQRGNLEALCAQLDLRESVSMPGVLADPTGELAGADIFAFSSRREGFGMALAEAMACGLPVVSFDCPSGPGEIVTDGVDGLLVSPGDVEAFANALDTLIGDEGARLRLGAEARRVADRYAIDEVMAKWDGLLRGLCSASGEAASSSRGTGI